MKTNSHIPRWLCTAAITCLSACGGSSGGGDVGDIARDESTPLDDDQTVAGVVMQDSSSCPAEIDIADFFLTEIDRQWSCEITAGSGASYDDVYFSRDGSVAFANGGAWYWNRSLPGGDVNLASPEQPSKLMSGISSSNTVLMFTTTTVTGEVETYDCVLVPREVNS